MFLPLPFQAHISSYTGHTKVNRLLFIASRSAGKPLELEALKLVHDQLRRVSGALGRDLQCTSQPWMCNH